MVIVISIIMEFCDNGDLFQKIVQHHKDKTRFEEQGKLMYFLFISRNLECFGSESQGVEVPAFA
jgi:hypothetical protein